MTTANLAPQGACFGFTVRSNVRFEHLRPGAGIPLQIEEEMVESPPHPSAPPLMRWLPNQANPSLAELFQIEDSFLFRLGEGGWFLIDPRARTISMPPAEEPSLRETSLWGIPIVICAIEEGFLPLHGAAIEAPHGAIILAAPGASGKTTVAAASAASGHRLLSEDIACCSFVEGPAVLPGPASLRLRPDVYEHVRVPATHLEWMDSDRIHLVLEEDVRGDASPVSLSALVFVRPGDSPLAMERRDPVEALPDLWSLGSKMPTDEQRARCLERITDLAGAVPLWNLHRPLRFEALPEIVAAVIEQTAV